MNDYDSEKTSTFISLPSLMGYFLEVDLEYSDELHELHNNYPPSPEKLVVSSDMLLNYCKKLLISMR